MTPPPSVSHVPRTASHRNTPATLADGHRVPGAGHLPSSEAREPSPARPRQPSAPPPPQPQGVSSTDCLGHRLRWEGISASGEEPAGNGRSGSLTVRGAPRGRARTTEAGAAAIAAAVGVSTPSTRREPRVAPTRLSGTPPPPPIGGPRGWGEDCFRPISGPQRTANGRCATASRAGPCGCAVRALT